MRSILALLAFCFVALTPAWVTADEFPHLEFARGLRARNYPDLALDYLNQLTKDPKLPPAVARLLPLEIARASLDLAAAEPDPSRRVAQYQHARAQFEAFIKANANQPEAVQASLDLARVYVVQAKVRQAEAMRAEGAERQAALKPVRALFEEAGKRLQEAAKRISAVPNANDPVVKQAQLDATFEVARNYLDQMTTYDLDREAVPRGELGKRAVAELKAVAKNAPDNPTGWLARAWVVRAYDELDSLPEAMEAYQQFEKAASGRTVEPARRLARWHYLQVLARRDPGGKDRDTLNEMVRIATEWLRDYAGDRFTAEGQGVRFHLAQAYRHQAALFRDLRAEKTQELQFQAERLYAALEQEDGEYSERARRHKVELLVKRKPELAQGNVERLNTFDDCYLRAQIEGAQMTEEAKDPKADAKKLEQQRRKHIQNVIAALNRGLALAERGRVAARDLIDARFLLIFYLLETKEPYRAAVLGEDLARSNPLSSRAANAGAYAVYAYAQIIGEQEKADAPPMYVEADRQRLRRLAHYIELNWPGELAADACRHQLGLLALRQKNYPDAVAVLARVSPSYSQYAQVQFQLASAAIQSHKDKLPPPKGAPGWQEQASAAFRRIPEPSASDPEAVRAYLYAKLELAKLHYAAKQFDAMDAFVAKLGEQLAMERDEKVRAELKTTLDSLAVYARFGRADAEFRSNHADRYAKVRALIDPVVSQYKAKKLPPLDPKLIQSVLGLALRANVLDGQTGKGREVLDLLQQSAAGEGDNSALLIDLVQQLRGQLDELRKKGPTFQPEVDKTVTKFTAFLDELATQPAKGRKPEMVRFLAYSYSGLDKHAEAAALLAGIPPPEKPEDQKFYNVSRLMYAHELRLAKKYDEAGAALKAIAQTEFGKHSLEARKEEALLQEDQEKFAAAANRWNQLMGDLRKLKGSNPQFADQFNDCLFHYIHCVYQYGAKSDDDAKRKKYIQRAAHLIVTLEQGDPGMGGLKERYQAYLDKEPSLKDQYEQQSRKNRPTR